MKLFSLRKNQEAKEMESDTILSLINNAPSLIRKGVLISATIAVIATSHSALASSYSTDSVMPASTPIEHQMKIDSEIIEFNGETIHQLHLTTAQMKAIYDANGIDNLEFDSVGDLSKEQVVDAFESTSLPEIMQELKSSGKSAEDFAEPSRNYGNSFPDGNYSSTITINSEYLLSGLKAYQFDGSMEFVKNHEQAHTLDQVNTNFEREIAETSSHYDTVNGALTKEAVDALTKSRTPYNTYLNEVYADLFSLVKTTNENPSLNSQDFINDVISMRIKERHHYSKGQGQMVYDIIHDTASALQTIDNNELAIQEGADMDALHAKTVSIMKHQAELGNVMGPNEFTIKNLATKAYINPAINGQLNTRDAEYLEEFNSSRNEFLAEAAYNSSSLPPGELAEMAKEAFSDYIKNDWSESNAYKRGQEDKLSRYQAKAEYKEARWSSSIQINHEQSAIMGM